MSCENCYCYDCEQERIQSKHQEELRKLCESWNWNASPTEVARDIYDKGLWAPDVWKAMEKFGFSENTIAEACDAYESLH